VEFYKIRKHYLIFTEAGKPIYSLYRQEDIISPFFSSLSSVIPKITGYFWDNNISAKYNTN